MLLVAIGLILVVFRKNLAAHTAQWDERLKRTRGVLDVHQYTWGWAMAGVGFVAFGLIEMMWPQ